MKRNLSKKLLAFVCAFALAGAMLPIAGCAAQKPAPDQEPEAAAKLAIIHTNDTHGYDMAAEPTDSTPGALGMAAVAQLKKDYEAQGYEVLLFDDGDAIQDNVLVNLSEGEAAIDFMNTAGYDAMSIGNHEFDWGADNLEKLIARAKFPVLAANITIDATGESFAQDQAVFDMGDGLKVGVFGLATPETQTKSSPKNVAGLSFAAGEDLYRCAQDQVDELKAQGCTVIVCLGHLGSVGATAPNRSIDVLENTEGIDVFIDGHDHKVVNETVNGSLLVSTGCHTENIGVVLYENNSFSEHMVEYGSYEGSDAATEELVVKTHDEVKAQLSQTIGTTEVALDGERDPGVRTQETNLGDFAADAMLWQAQQASDQAVDGAIVNGGSIRASIGIGDISMETLTTVFPYNNSLNVVTLKGSELLEILEAATFSLPEATGGFPQVAGIAYRIDTITPYENGEQYPDSTYFAPMTPGSRITIDDVGGRGFSLEDEYVIAASSFITSGGDTYYAAAEAYEKTGYITGYTDTDALVNFVRTELEGVIGEAYAQPKERVLIAVE
ncbi:bifunctional metallophosphatase/5'-nucleotidase [Raoultibacter phocaeensis]|uniref:bifunctional metallophosphatase/5'-nucleotidase n=1 Tax=Raoultibacter phocaeensis TaxID=2479841 RepID=UPI0015D65F37|nr:bifunctional UDP-sugar hydrolase/5'-nucleotidase [Raoultibacter phocaeensis]